MLGRTAGGLLWMFRYLERSENTARMIEAGFRIALTRPGDSAAEWAAVIEATGQSPAYSARHDSYGQAQAIDFLLRDRANPSSVLVAIEQARINARMVRTALSREVWEATNEAWMETTRILARPVRDADLPEVLAAIRRHNALVRGALHGSMLRNEIYSFARIGTFIERADNTARILDVKYYVLLPSVQQIGSPLDNVQWESILRAVGALRSYRWLNGADISPRSIAEFLIFDVRMPRSLMFSVERLAGNMGFLAREYDLRLPSHDKADALLAGLQQDGIDDVIDRGLHEFILDFLGRTAALGHTIETDYRFYG